MAELVPREAVRKMAPYSPPSGGREGKLRLDFNENTIGCSPKVIKQLRKHLTASHLSVYPGVRWTRGERNSRRFLKSQATSSH